MLATLVDRRKLLLGARWLPSWRRAIEIEPTEMSELDELMAHDAYAQHVLSQ
jgi:hypothetical protein